jgi:hypothetical protein
LAGDLGTGSYEATDEVTGQGVKPGAGYYCKSQVGLSINVLDLWTTPVGVCVVARTKPAWQGREGYKNGIAREGKGVAVRKNKNKAGGVRVSYSTQTNPLWRGVYQNER